MSHGSLRGPALVVAALALVLAGCSHAPRVNSSTGMLLDAMDAKISPTQGNTCHGTVQFIAEKDGSVRVIADLDGLTPNAQHAMHIHEVGDCSAPDAMSAKGHYNPEAKDHGLPPAEDRHAGDLGNVTADGSGHAHYEVTVHNISLTGTHNPVYGRAVIVHAKPDDGGQPTGNAGARLGCGVIEARKL
ncbi:MAG: superoxide dismutase family protein [Candidatus Eisenbacteria bacterium]